MIFSSIGRAISGVARSFTSGGGLGGLLKTGLSALTGGGLGGKIGDMLGGLAEKGISKLMGKVSGFMGQLGPLASLAQGPLSMLGGMLGQLGQKGGLLGRLASFASDLIGKMGGAQNLPAPGLNNLTEMFAKTHAQNLLGNILR